MHPSSSRRSLRSIVIVSAAALSLGAAFADPAPAGHPLTVDDMLAMDHIGRVEVADGGQKILFERGGPSEGFADYGIDDPSAGGRIYVYDRSSGAPPRRLIGGKFDHQNWIGALSPDGDKVAVYWLDGEWVRAGVIDLKTGKLTKFALNPLYDFEQTQPVWVSDAALVYATVAPDEHSPRVDFRRRATIKVSEGWQRAWHGEVSASVLESHATDFTPDWRTGSLVRADVASGKVTTLADGRYVELSLSPDKHFLAAARQGGYLRFRPDAITDSYDAHRLEPRLIDLTGASAPVAMCAGCQLSGISEFTWGASGHRVSFFARFGDEQWDRARFRVFDADTKALTEIRHVGLDLASFREIGQQNSPVDAIPFGDGALVAARKQADPKADPIFTPKVPTHLPSFNIKTAAAATLGRLDWYYVAPDGTSRAVTAAIPDVDSVTVASDPTGLYFLGGNKVIRVDADGSVRDAADFDGMGMLYRLDGSLASNGHAVAVTASPQTGIAVQFFEGAVATGSVKLPPTIGRPLAADPKSGVVVFTSADATGTVLTAVDHAGAHPIVAINQHLRNVAPATQVMLNYTLPNGQPGKACMLRPAGAPAGKPLPTIVYTYPTSAGSCEVFWRLGLADTYGPEILTGFGYAVLFPDNPASLLANGTNPVANWGALDTAAVNEAVKEGLSDKDRLGAWGMSLGGHSVLSLLSQTNVFKAGIALNGVANFSSNYASIGLVRGVMSDDLFAIGHAQAYETEPDEGLYIGAKPWEKPDAFAEASPLSHAGEMNTPLMLMSGDLDWDYQMNEFDQYFTALLRQGKEAVYVRYWGEGHGDFSPANVRDAWQRMHAWYEGHFK